MEKKRCNPCSKFNLKHMTYFVPSWKVKCFWGEKRRLSSSIFWKWWSLSKLPLELWRYNVLSWQQPLFNPTNMQDLWVKNSGCKYRISAVVVTMKPNLTPHRWPSNDYLAVLWVYMCGVSILAWHKTFGKHINRVICQFGSWAALELSSHRIGEEMKQLNNIHAIKWLVNKLLWSNTVIGFYVKNNKQMW